MFIIDITYKVEIEKVEEHIEAHIEFLNEEYEKGTFLASGKKVPRTGGVILSNIASKEKLEKILEKDPFKKYELANFEITEFVVSKTAKELELLKEV